MTTQDPTTNYGWDLPEVGGSTGTWGTELNTLLGDDATGIDAIVKAISDVADAAIPLAGGTFTGNVVFGSGCAVRENSNTMSALDVDWSLGNFFTKALPPGVSVITFSNPPPALTVQFITIQLNQPGGGSATVTWPGTVDWQDGVPPTLATGGAEKDILVFYTVDGGSSFIGAHSISNPS